MCGVQRIRVVAAGHWEEELTSCFLTPNDQADHGTFSEIANPGPGGAVWGKFVEFEVLI